ncbi:MAG: hypothetical protein IAF38_08150 [Bacteroidia bacterium]|nr:hypothetical protein [Bacteroidia bacterium]
MRNYFFILFILSIGFSKAQFEGQWLSDKALLDCAKGDTIEITRTKFKDNFFQWGQPPFGIEFGKDSSFSEFYTVLCSTESSPLVNSDEKWKAENKDVVSVNGEKRNITLKVIYRKGKKIRMILL